MQVTKCSPITLSRKQQAVVGVLNRILEKPENIPIIADDTFSENPGSLLKTMNLALHLLINRGIEPADVVSKKAIEGYKDIEIYRHIALG